MRGPMAPSTPDLMNVPLPVAAGADLSVRHPQAFQIAGGSGAWRRLLSQADAIAPRLSIAFIEGEEGSGKQTLARYLHARSQFARFVFQRHDARRWLAARAATAPIEGFVYLDRVELLSADEQKLLWVVTRNLHDTPGNYAGIVMSARTPLGRLPSLPAQPGVAAFSVPALRSRREDVASLAQFIIERACKGHGQPKPSLAPGVLARLMQYDWPGNVRELAAVLESALLEARDGVIRIEALRIPACSQIRVATSDLESTAGLDLHTVIRQHVRHVLNLNQGNKLRSSRQLGISRSTLYRILGNESVLGR